MVYNNWVRVKIMIQGSDNKRRENLIGEPYSGSVSGSASQPCRMVLCNYYPYRGVNGQGDAC